MKRRTRTDRRGRTRSGRLRLLDPLFREGGLSLPAGKELQAVDLGFGDEPITSFEWYEALMTRERMVHVTAIERDETRVARARRLHQAAPIRIEPGSFGSCARVGPPPLIIRAMNVLRGYPLEQVRQAQLEMIGALAPGGVLVEGTSDTEGHLVSAHLWRRHEQDRTFDYEGLFLATDFERGFAPRMFRDVLPRDLRRHVHPGEPIFEWLTLFQELVDDLRSGEGGSANGRAPESTGVQSNRRLFEVAARQLRLRSSETSLRWLDHGALLWHPPAPSARQEVLRPGPIPDAS